MGPYGPTRSTLRRRAPLNFGIFAAPDRRLVFSINDFDEILPGPFEWDVKRSLASIVVAGRDRGFDAEVCRSVVMAATREYREAMARFARCATSTSGTRGSTSRRSSNGSEHRCPQADEAFAGQRRQGAHEGQHTSPRKAVWDGRRRARDRRRSSPRHADRGRGTRCGAGPLEDVVRRMIGTYTRTLPHVRRNLLEETTGMFTPLKGRRRR